MTDVIDRAQFAEQVHRDDALARRAQRQAVEPLARSHCLDCAGEIGARRLAAMPSAQRCVPCQDAWERRHG